jgi:2-polyprenyl-3-methyl-5-hydroxy-6-metoxy-1,4-benzoquinol methylase
VKVLRYYQDANLLTRLLVATRPLICPIEPILALVPEDADILDIGCGVGLLSINLATMLNPKRIAGFDTNANAVAVAKAAATRVRNITDADITFFTARDFSEWPTDLFDVVCMVDVAHHVPRELWNTLYQSAAARVRDGGLLLYKDMAADPWWCGLGSRLHDLILAQQWIHYCPLSFVHAALAAAGMTPVHHDEWRKYWYMHQFTVFKKGRAGEARRL